MNSLAESLKEYKSIGVAGMCKNAGKTTVLNYLIKEYRNDYVLGITSIGYDGEKQDEVTRLEKPRIRVYPGMYAATCGVCLADSTAKCKTTLETGIMTALGEVLIVKVQSEGYLEVAGPSMVAQIEVIGAMLQKLGCQKILVDGAAGRTSFVSRMEAAVLSVGAAMHHDMHRTIMAAKHQAEMFAIETSEESYSVNFTNDRPYAVLKNDNEARFIFRGAMVADDLAKIMKEYKAYIKIAVVNDASCIFITPRMYDKFARKQGRILVQSGTNLVAVTINPMSPYGMWYDKKKFLEQMKEHMNLPVYNVLDEENDGEQAEY
ncbi:MAG: hypothetical protein JXN65_01605 [Clostridia bacterium]|nr:hypothetical protein [Clostridia bacterium]